MHNVPQHHNVCARWVPRQLTPQLKEQQMDACEELLLRYQTEADTFLQHTVTGDEN
jgi:predicted DsbA family dithiol-disulfide isomerase